MDSTEKLENIGNFLFKYRGQIPVIFLVIGLVIRYFHYHNGDGFADYYDFSCLVVSLLGFFMRVHAVGYSPKGTSGRNTGRQLAANLNMTGLYSIVRHPLYLANFFIWLPIAMLSYSTLFCLFFLIFFVIFYGKIIQIEEEFLEKKFGNLYLEWQAQTPLFIPNFTMYDKSYMAFNWKKVLRKEKNGITAIFTTFFLFRIADAMGSHMSVVIFLSENVFWIVSFVLSIVFYIFIKVLMIKSSWIYPR